MKKSNFLDSMSRDILNNKYIEGDNSESIGEKIKVLALGLIIGMAYDVFFVGEFIGISALLFISLFIVISVWSVHSKVNLSNKLSLIFLLTIILLSLSYSIYNNPILRGLNAIIIPLLISGYILLIRYKNIKEINISFIENTFTRLVATPLENFTKGPEFTKNIVQSKNKENPVRKAVIRGLIISIPLLAVILGLLRSADAMFSYHIKNIIDIFNYMNIEKLIGHTIVILFVTNYSVGFLWSLRCDEEIDSNKRKIECKLSWNSITVLTIICCISIVYLIFSVVQISYLYGDSENIIKSGFTYAEYARRGFFELVIVTLINFTILILSINFTKVDGRKVAVALKVLYSLLIIFTFNMIFSSFYKMNLYEQAFGYTRLRILVQIFIVYLGALLLIVLSKVWKKKIKALKLGLIVSMAFYIGLNFINIDKLIIKNNIDRYFETGNIDMEYITSLSCDGIEEMERLLKVEDNYVVKENAKTYINKKQEELNQYYDKWYEFNYYKKKTQAVKIGSK
ncbi:DUF4153 domain-containing protein [Gottschalkia acidurici]|nr:DUF4173 domain-containing protein [Gottschalkia acidurici]